MCLRAPERSPRRRELAACSRRHARAYFFAFPYLRRAWRSHPARCFFGFFAQALSAAASFLALLSVFSPVDGVVVARKVGDNANASVGMVVIVGRVASEPVENESQAP